MEFMRASEITPEVAAAVDDAFEYHKWDTAKVAAGVEVRRSLAEAVKVIIANVPPCPTRTRAINNLFDARMLANSAITHDGKL